YRYFAESANGKSVVSQSLSNTSNSALVRLATTEMLADAELPPLTNATLKNTPVSLDLHAQFDAIGLDVSDWTLSEEVTLPYNHNALVDVDVANQTLTYTPESDFTGIDRILFSFTDAEQNPRMGHVDIAVSVEGNQGLIVEEDIIYPTPVIYGESVEIDISPYVTSPDEDDYQLVYLQSFHADVAPSNPNDVYNKSFTFSSTTFGPNIVTFAVSDHKGSYTVGVMQIEVEGNTPWGDISYDGKRFLAPLTTKQADAQGIVYEKGQSDSDYPSLEMALMTPPQFEAYCASRAASVTTLDQWQALTSNVNIKDDHQWPVQYGFAVDNNGTYYQAWSDGTSESLNGAAVKPMCVQSSYLLVVPSQSDLEAVANSQDQAEVAVKVTFGGELVEGENVSASLNEDSSAQLEAKSVITDGNGVAVFELTNLKAETVTLTVEYSGKRVDAEVKFIGDINTAKLEFETEPRTELDYDGVFDIRAMLTDVNENPLPGYNVDFKVLNNEDLVDLYGDRQTDINGELLLHVDFIGPIPSDRDTEFTLQIMAEPQFIDKDTLKIAFRALPICGGRFNDNDRYNASGRCLKVVAYNYQGYVDKLSTSSPSLSVMEFMGYTRQDEPDNEGKTYSYLREEIGRSGGEYATFRLESVEGQSDQARRFCAHLSRINFAGHNEWILSRVSDLETIYTGLDTWQAFGWPTVQYYWTSATQGSKKISINMIDGKRYTEAPPSHPGYTSCVVDL
ncbi:hypothetical protein PO80_19320, partial [Vibrio parahaemolyticus]|uniref:Ig-like domain-containing protein n=2 Tax=Vibrio parahaemolyticus TaxID=670 RepID=UPI0005435F01